MLFTISLRLLPSERVPLVMKENLLSDQDQTMSFDIVGTTSDTELVGQVMDKRVDLAIEISPAQENVMCDPCVDLTENDHTYFKKQNYGN